MAAARGKNLPLGGRTAWRLAFVGLLVGGLAWIWLTRQPDLRSGDPDLEAPQVGFLAPELTLRGLDGQPVHLADHRGQPLVLNFWATWCPPCRQEMPALQRAAREHQQLVVLGVNVQESPAAVRDFLDAFGLTFPVAIDPDGSALRRYRVTGIPATFFIDREGRIQASFRGPLDEVILGEKLAVLLGP